MKKIISLILVLTCLSRAQAQCDMHKNMSYFVGKTKSIILPGCESIKITYAFRNEQEKSTYTGKTEGAVILMNLDIILSGEKAKVHILAHYDTLGHKSGVSYNLSTTSHGPTIMNNQDWFEKQYSIYQLKENKKQFICECLEKWDN